MSECKLDGSSLFDPSLATNSSVVALLTDQPLLPYDQLACDTPTRAQAEFLSVSSCALELLQDAGEAVPWAASAGGGRL
jgi:hypothetical protein